MKLTSYTADWEDRSTQAIASEYRKVFKAKSWAEVPVTMGNVVTDKAAFCEALGSNVVNAEAIAEVLANDPDAQTYAERKGYEVPESEEYTPDSRIEDWLECLNYNLASYKSYRGKDDSDDRLKTCHRPVTCGGGRLDGYLGSARTGDKAAVIDHEAYANRVAKISKQRRYHGIETICLNAAGQVRGLRDLKKSRISKEDRIAAKLAKLDAKRKK